MNQEMLKALINYNPDTGRFFHRPRPGNNSFNRQFAGHEALSVCKRTGYSRIRIGKTRYSAHRLAWLYVHGEFPEAIDHINGNRLDNRICNLRSVTQSVNCKNYGVPIDNKTGVMGVRKENRTGKWTAQIRANRKFMHIGTFEDYFDAVCARKSKEVELGFHPNHGIHESWRHDPRVKSKSGAIIAAGWRKGDS